MLIRTISTTLLQIFHDIILSFEVIVECMLGPGNLLELININPYAAGG